MARKPPRVAASRVVGADAVQRMHDSLCAVLRRHATIPDDATMSQLNVSLGNWSRTTRGVLEFVLHSKSTTECAIRPRAGSVVPVFAVQNADAMWLSWFQRWQKYDLKSYELDRVSCSFWFGRSYQRAKRLLFRAEWDCFESVVENRAAQPHWHVDFSPGLVGRDQGGSVVPETPAGETVSDAIGARMAVPTDAATSVSICEYHLGMRGTWDGSRERRGWHTRISSTGSSVADWAESCVAYMCAQMRRYPIIGAS